jgi:hypothetical protein
MSSEGPNRDHQGAHQIYRSARSTLIETTPARDRSAVDSRDVDNASHGKSSAYMSRDTPASGAVETHVAQLGELWDLELEVLGICNPPEPLPEAMGSIPSTCSGCGQKYLQGGVCRLCGRRKDRPGVFVGPVRIA